MLLFCAREDQGVMAMKGYSAFSKACFESYLGHLLGGGLTPLQRYSWYILRLKPSGGYLMPRC